ncbi:MAG: hypothetical protein COW18_05040 [Zetaproteobacteria bacterium CG12_big_fil_rev_8_21_14_0_65_54_13]|nr:MAG: hypothetical protein COW18_05040 [Zetaproteobacteria bacterium CG12_big_fil_rev_8_21_14_0_65_54_13]PIX53709.1 MAG: hypothetical protein COZ50_11665 [Zetaproteobacteria bacterium CG_4_10_14_3_um_filter_54_28]PJA31196.1 MAG: hypothetical protein CO188_00270 [Zetaproteobacteria bacterium CG_4_9_14_3_um_filter_54_145]
MIFPVADTDKKQARWPHNLFVLNIFFCNLLMTPAAIVLNVGMYGFLIPLVCSLSVIAAIYLRSTKKSVWFVDMHWRLCFQRCLWLMGGYGITALLMLVGWLISLTAADARMADIMFTAISRIAVLPTLLAVMVTVVFEAGGLQLVSKGEVPDKLVERYPPA